MNRAYTYVNVVFHFTENVHVTYIFPFCACVVEKPGYDFTTTHAQQGKMCVARIFSVKWKTAFNAPLLVFVFFILMNNDVRETLLRKHEKKKCQAKKNKMQVKHFEGHFEQIYKDHNSKRFFARRSQP